MSIPIKSYNQVAVAVAAVAVEEVDVVHASSVARRGIWVVNVPMQEEEVGEVRGDTAEEDVAEVVVQSLSDLF
jgi:hypothetical protein